MQHPVWKELMETWIERKEDHTREIMDGVDNEGNKLTLEDIHYRRGQIKDLDFSMIQPELIIEEIKDEQASEPVNEDEDNV